MRNIVQPQVERGRVRDGPLASPPEYGHNGAFEVHIRTATLWCIVSDQKGWDHVSVSVVDEKNSRPGQSLQASRCPTWEEMHAVKRLFWRDDEAVFQLHPPKHLYVNDNAFCLHLWRQQGKDVPLPPTWMVGVGAGS